MKKEVKNMTIRELERPIVIGGPCAIESEEQALSVARKLKEMGVPIFRGMLWKPRSSKDSFQGIGLQGLSILERIKKETGMLITTEIVDREQIEETQGIVDFLWVGSNNMQNYELLKSLAKDSRLSILKRGRAATVKEWLDAADYIGKDKVILCERGIRTPVDSMRFTLDLNGALVAKHDHNMLVIGDPSHSAGRRDMVPYLARTIIAAGLDGIVIEVHDDPEQASCDARQQITPETFHQVLSDIRSIHGLLREERELRVA